MTYFATKTGKKKFVNKTQIEYSTAEYYLV